MACTETDYVNTQDDHDLTLVFRQANARDWIAGSFTVGVANITVCQVKFTFHTRTNTTPTPNTLHCEIWSDNAGTPNAQVGIDSGTAAFTAIALDATNTELTFAWGAGAGPQLTSGVKYWVIIQPDWAAGNTHYCSMPYGGDGKGNKYGYYDIDATTWTFAFEAGDNPLMSVYKETGGVAGLSIPNPLGRVLSGSLGGPL